MTFDNNNMKTGSEDYRKFIGALLRQGWKVDGDEIHSAKSYLHFPYPEGWHDDLQDLEEIMLRRRSRFKDPNEMRVLETEANRDLLILVHTQAIDAIHESRKQ